MAEEPKPRRARRRLRGAGAGLLAVVATLLLIVAALAIWIDRVALDTDTWTETSTQLLTDPAIAVPLSDVIASKVETQLQVEDQVREFLPDRADPLAPAIAAAVNDVVERTVMKVLEAPRTEAAWERIMRGVHSQAIAVIDGQTRGAQPDGSIAIDLAPIIADAAARVGVSGDRIAALPPDAGLVTIVPSGRLDNVRALVHTLRILSTWLGLVCFLLYAAAIWLAADRRRQLLWIGIGLVVAAVVIAAARAAVGGYLPGAIATTPDGEGAVRAAWRIVSDPLGDIVVTLGALGVLVVLAAALAGPGRRERAARAAIGPWLRDPRKAFGGLALVLLLLIAWGPVPATRKPLTVVLVGGSAVLGIVLLRRQIEREGSVDSPQEGVVSTAADGARSHAQELALLAELHAGGALDDGEFAAAKGRLLGPPETST